MTREVAQSGQFAAFVTARAYDCVEAGECHRQEIYDSLTGHPGSPQEPYTALSAGMRTGLYNYLSVGWPLAAFDGFHALGPHSYFGESAYEMPDWPARLWGRDTFDALSAVKQRVDPAGLFWCRHCVGDNNFEL